MLLGSCQHRSALESDSRSGVGWTSADSLETRSLELLNERLTSAYEREDVPLLRELLADAHIHNNVFGARLDRDAFLRDIELGILEFVSYETPTIEWFVRGGLAVATGVIEAVAIRDGRPVPANQFRFTRIFVRESDGWRVLLFQNTMMGATSRKSLPE